MSGVVFACVCVVWGCFIYVDGGSVVVVCVVCVVLFVCCVCVVVAFLFFCF